MERYKSYKDSGSDWIGEIPAAWETKKLKFLGEVTLGKMLCPEDKGGYELKPYLKSKNIGRGKVLLSTVDQMWFSQAELNSYRLKGGDILLSEGGEVGKAAIWNDELSECYIQNSVHRVRIDDQYHSRYFFYYLTHLEGAGYYKSIASQVSIAHLTKEKLIRVPCVVPDKSDQIRIASYLDNKTTRLSEIIEQKELLLEKLQAKRQAIINEAVTKGINPEVEMKPSGVEWLGNIPEHWKVKQVKHIKERSQNSFVDGPFGSNLKSEHFIDNGEVLVIESGFITKGQFVEKQFKTISREHFETIKRSECKEGDIIISKIGANYGMSGILPELGKQSVVSGNSMKLTVDKQICNVEFIHCCLLFIKMSGVLKLIVNETAQPALSLGTMNNLHLPVPSLDEQNKIVGFIKRRVRKVDELNSLLNTQIEKLKEYRQSLISEVVTGKIKVI